MSAGPELLKTFCLRRYSSGQVMVPVVVVGQRMYFLSTKMTLRGRSPREPRFGSWRGAQTTHSWFNILEKAVKLIHYLEKRSLAGVLSALMQLIYCIIPKSFPINKNTHRIAKVFPFWKPSFLYLRVLVLTTQWPNVQLSVWNISSAF